MNQSLAAQHIQQVLCQHGIPVLEHQWVSLPMTPLGWRRARRNIPSFAGIYVHFSSCGVPLRVGIAVGKDGIRSRWFMALSCHRISFQQHPSAPQNYKSFFAQIQRTYQSTFLLCMATEPQLAAKGERALIKDLTPLWEVRGTSGRYVWKEKKSFAENPFITLSETEELQQRMKRRSSN